VYIRQINYESRIKWSQQLNGSAVWATELKYTSGILLNLDYRGQRFRESGWVTWQSELSS